MNYYDAQDRSLDLVARKSAHAIRLACVRIEDGQNPNAARAAAHRAITIALKHSWAWRNAMTDADYRKCSDAARREHDRLDRICATSDSAHEHIAMIVQGVAS